MKEKPSFPSTKDAEAEVPRSDSLVVYSNPSNRLPVSVKKTEKKGLFRRNKRVSGPTREQITKFFFAESYKWVDALPEIEARMLRGVFSLSTTIARAVMTPLSELMAVHVATPTEQVKAMVRHSNYHYVPVYDERVDRLTGIVNIMDILYASHETNDLSSFVQSAYYIPETKLMSDLLEELRSAEDPVAIVIDEHGGCVGFVTMEDIIEQVVGEIRYNHKRHTLYIESLGNGAWALDARTSIDVTNEELGTNIPKDGCDTIGGFILMLLGRLPEQGEKIAYGNFQFTVEEVFDYGISRFHVTQIRRPNLLKK